METGSAKIDGVKVRLGEKEYVVPPLTIGQVRRLKNELASVQSSGSGDAQTAFDNGLVVIQAAMSRNYPEITVDQLYDIIDMANYKIVIPAIMGLSGFVSSQGEAVA